MENSVDWLISLRLQPYSWIKMALHKFGTVQFGWRVGLRLSLLLFSSLGPHPVASRGYHEQPWKPSSIFCMLHLFISFQILIPERMMWMVVGLRVYKEQGTV
jgi:hypothetical protein